MLRELKMNGASQEKIDQGTEAGKKIIQITPEFCAMNLTFAVLSQTAESGVFAEEM